MNASSRFRGRKVVTVITKPSYRFYIRRYLTVILVVAVVVLYRISGKYYSKLYRNDDNDSSVTANSETTTSVIEPSIRQQNSNQTALQERAVKSPEKAVGTLFDTKRDHTGNSNSYNGKEQFTNEIDLQQQQQQQQPTVIHFTAYEDDGIEMLMELDGLNGSKGIHLITDSNASTLHPNLVWIGSPVRRRDCNMNRVKQALAFYYRMQPKNHGKHPTTMTMTMMMKEDWTFHLLDWSDFSHKLLRCKALEALVGINKVHYWKRSIVSGRSWNNVTNTIVPGQITTEIRGAKIRPLFLSTRTDIVKGIAAAVANETNHVRVMNERELTEYLVNKERPGDLIHHWPAKGGKVDRGSPTNRNDWLRTKTSLTLRKMNKPPYNLSNVYCGIYGVAKDKGRGSTTALFIQSLLRYKIIVVTQRDIFEGHLRLFEGLVSGALVIHDRILSLPNGLEENVNIVFFDNQDELKEKVMYYLNHKEERLAIARRGRQLAMCQSRTWHRMEQIILGKTVTPCNE